MGGISYLGRECPCVCVCLGLIRMSRHLKMTFALKKLIKCRDMSRHLPENFDI